MIKLSSAQWEELIKPSPPKLYRILMSAESKEKFDKVFKECFDDFIITGEARIPVPKKSSKNKFGFKGKV
jgi:hypothetical protein